ncbi:MAG: glycosyltransferase, partial [Planctomycetales bacterium]
LGLGSAIVAGMQYAIQHDYQFMLNMDGDFSHDPRYLPTLMAGMDPESGPPVDVMIGSRYIFGGGVKGWSPVRHLMSRSINLYARLLLSLPTRDCSGGFRCYRISTLKMLDFNRIRSTGYSFYEEILWRLKLAGARFAETPIVFVDRKKGESKINGAEAVAAVKLILELGLKYRI